MEMVDVHLYTPPHLASLKGKKYIRSLFCLQNSLIIICHTHRAGRRIHFINILDLHFWTIFCMKTGFILDLTSTTDNPDFNPLPAFSDWVKIKASDHEWSNYIHNQESVSFCGVRSGLDLPL